MVYLDRKSEFVSFFVAHSVFETENYTMKIFTRNLKALSVVGLLLLVLILQNCKRAIVNTPTSLPTKGMYALINDTVWTPPIVSASLAYDASNKSKTFTCIGTMGDKIIQLVASQNNVVAGNNFPIGNINGSSVSYYYYIQPIHRELTEQNPTFGNAPGTNLTITEIDTSKQLISGTFTFPQVDSAYDPNYNFIFSTTNQIKNGFFKQIHYGYNH